MKFQLIAWKLWEELITQTYYPILNVVATDGQTDGQGQQNIMHPDCCHGGIIAWELWEELITQTCYPILNVGATDRQTGAQHNAP